LTEFGGGGSGQSHDEVTTDEHGIPHRALDLDLRYHVCLASLSVALEVPNRAGRTVDFEIAWVLDADFADIQEAQPSGFAQWTGHGGIKSGRRRVL
jgi:hypothetical protein